MATRPVREVFEDHLRNRKNGELDADLRDNYAEDVVLLTCYGVFHGHDGVRKSEDILHRNVPNATFDYVQTLDAKEMAYLEWTAHGDDVDVRDGVDSYLIRDGRILVQTIHYKPVRAGDET